MKKKSPRGIPDFSRHPSGQKGVVPSDGGAPQQKVVRSAPPRTKPPATSAKSGQRGT